MDLTHARRVVRDPDAGVLDRLVAATVLRASAETTLDDLLACLTREDVPAEIAAAELYGRTGRPRSADWRTWSADHGDWEQWLRDPGPRASN